MVNQFRPTLTPSMSPLISSLRRKPVERPLVLEASVTEMSFEVRSLTEAILMTSSEPSSQKRIIVHSANEIEAALKSEIPEFNVQPLSSCIHHLLKYLTILWVFKIFSDGCRHHLGSPSISSCVALRGMIIQERDFSRTFLANRKAL